MNYVKNSVLILFLIGPLSAISSTQQRSCSIFYLARLLPKLLNLETKSAVTMEESLHEFSKIVSIWRRFQSPAPTKYLQPDEVLNSMVWMRNSLSTFRKQKMELKKNRNLFLKRQNISTAILSEQKTNQLWNSLNRFTSSWLKSPRNLSVREFTVVSEQLTLLLSVRDYINYGATTDGLPRVADFLKSYGSALDFYSQNINATKISDDYWQDLELGLALPSPVSIPMGTFNQNLAFPVGILGLVNSMIEVDGIMRSPYDFFLHDLEHFQGQILSIRAGIQEDQTLNKQLVTIESFVNRRLALQTRLNKNISLLSEKNQRLVHLVLFTLFHEMELIFDSKKIKDLVSSDKLRTDYGKYIFDRLSSSNDTVDFLLVPATLGDVDFALKWLNSNIE